MNDSGFYRRKNPHRLYRDRQNAMIAGVCAGIAEYAGLNRKGTRLVLALLCLLFIMVMLKVFRVGLKELAR